MSSISQVPPNPLSMEEQKKRIPAMLERPYDIDALMREYGSREAIIRAGKAPGMDPACLFDLSEYGVRLVMSREIFEGQKYFHASSSIFDPVLFTHHLPELTPESSFVFIEGLIQELIPDTKLAVDEFHFGTVPHWYFNDVLPTPK